MEHSENLNELAMALCKAQGEMKAAVKDSVNPFFKSHFADLNSVWDACRAPLSKHGLSVSQVPGHSPDGHFILETVLMHSSGQWLSGSYPIAPVKPDPQSYGSALSYAKRYTLAAIVGVVTADDDAELAQGRGATNASAPRSIQRPAPSNSSPSPTKPPAPRQGYGPVTVTDPQIKRLIAIGIANGYTVDGIDSLMHSKYGHTSKKELRRDEYDWLVNYIQTSQSQSSHAMPPSAADENEQDADNIPF